MPQGRQYGGYHKAEYTRQDAKRWDTTRDTIRRDTTRQDTTRWDTTRDTMRRDTTRQDTTRWDTTRRTIRRDATRETVRRIPQSRIHQAGCQKVGYHKGHYKAGYHKAGYHKVGYQASVPGPHQNARKTQWTPAPSQSGVPGPNQKARKPNGLNGPNGLHTLSSRRPGTQSKCEKTKWTQRTQRPLKPASPNPIQERIVTWSRYALYRKVNPREACQHGRPKNFLRRMGSLSAAGGVAAWLCDCSASSRCEMSSKCACRPSSTPAS